jgi:hypothetical protein
MALHRALLPLLATFLLSSGCTRSDADKLASAQAMIASTTAMSIYRGIPYPLFDSRGHTDARAGETRAVPGGLAFSTPLPVTKEQQTRLTAAIRSIHTFERYQGPYKDGGYWPAYAIRWETPSGAIDVSFCGHVLLFEWGNNALHLICRDDALNSTIDDIVHAIEDAETKSRIDSAYGNPAEPQS